MAVKPDQLAVRVSAEPRGRLERAASLAGMSLPAFVVDTAVNGPEELLASRMSTSVSTDYFEQLASVP